MNDSIKEREKLDKLKKMNVKNSIYNIIKETLGFPDRARELLINVKNLEDIK